MPSSMCPSCKQMGFNWFMDDDALTHWYCHLCGFAAEEDERKLQPCETCGEPYAMWLLHDGLAYYWCNRCDNFRKP